AIEGRGDIGHLELARNPEQRSGDVLKTPGIPADVDACLRRRELPLELAPALEEMKCAGEVGLARDAEVHPLEEAVLLDWKVDTRAHVIEHLGPVRDVDVPGDRARRPF